MRILKKAPLLILFCLTIIGLITTLGCSSQNEPEENSDPDKNQNPSSLSEQTVMNLEAFSKLYGYVRFFHPSDEVERVNWSDFVIYGTEKILEVESELELKDTLESLFLPLAPTLVIYEEESIADTNFNIDNGEVVAWQHYGFEDPRRISNVYSSQRTKAEVRDGKIELISEQLFENYPAIGETINEKISPMLSVSIPLMLNLNSEGTTGSSNDSFNTLVQNISEVEQSTDHDFVRLSSIITSWNVYQHFYPYFHVVDTEWEEELIPALHNAYEARTEDEYLDALMSLLEKTDDGHTAYTDPRSTTITSELLLPFAIDIIDETLMITATESDSAFQPGDTVLSIDDLDPMVWLEDRKQFIPGSEQWKTYFSLQYLLTLPAEKIIIERDNEELTIDSFERSVRPIDEFYRPKTTEEVADDIFYFNLNSGVKEELNTFFDSHSSAKGLIIDLRGYPADNYLTDILSRLTEEAITGPISRVYHTIYPNRTNQTYSDHTVPIEPHETPFEGEVIFLAYEGSISNPEFILTYVENNNLGKIIGTPTAGSDGNISLYSIPPTIDNGTVTMLELLNSDESQTHVVGIEPDILIERTDEGVKNKEDEFINTAIEYINNQN